MYPDTECPYCEADQEINHDDGYGYEEGEKFEQECSECEKTFVYTTSISFDYDAVKADCLNGSDHQWKPVRVEDWERYATRKRCTVCDENAYTLKESVLKPKALEEVER